MKVVLFCGGLGTRLREHSDTIPKPLVNIGARPIIWHLMRYYAHFGHRDFVLCLGYQGTAVREYFLNYQETLTNDFTLHANERRVELHSSDMDDWNITFVDTGMHSNVGQRLQRVRKYVENEECFLANYADGLSDVPLDLQIADFKKRDVVASFASVRSGQSFHAIHADAEGLVTHVGTMQEQPLWIDGGFFVFSNRIFEYMEEGDDLVEKPFERLIQQRKLATYRWNGFWKCMDTLKDKISYDRMEAKGDCPWMVWRKPIKS